MAPAIFLGFHFYIGKACPFFECAFSMKAVFHFHHKEIPLDTSGHMDLLFCAGLQTFYCMDCIIQRIGQDNAQINIPQTAWVGQEEGTVYTYLHALRD